MRLRALSLSLVLALPLGAQDYWSLERIAAEEAANARTPHPPHVPSGADYTPNDPLAGLGEEAHFLSTLQVKSGFLLGGMKEGEHNGSIVQTDNTTESIWVWSRYRELTGDTQYDANLADAWTYVMNFPAYEEEGGSGASGYYRVYNCGWALIAEPQYRAVTGDTSYLAYAQQCADYVVQNPLSLGFGAHLNAQITAWAAGALYGFALEQGSASWRQAAADLGNAARLYAEANPSVLASESWAMSGGALVWGVLNSWFRENDGARTWAEVYGDQQKIIDTAGTWHNAHTGWYMLGAHAAWEASARGHFHRDHGEASASLLQQDGDDDGGIPTTIPAPDDEDETWVSNYIAFMGFERQMARVDVALASEQAQVAAGGNWVLDLGVANHDALAPIQPLCVLEIATGPSSGVPYLGPLGLHVPPGKLLVLKGYSVPIPAAVPPGQYSLRMLGALPGAPFDVAERTLFVP